MATIFVRNNHAFGASNPYPLPLVFQSGFETLSFSPTEWVVRSTLDPSLTVAIRPPEGQALTAPGVDGFAGGVVGEIEVFFDSVSGAAVTDIEDLGLAPSTLGSDPSAFFVGDHTLIGDATDTQLDGGAGDDTISAGAGDDAALGHDGADQIDLGDGSDVGLGQGGDDVIHGGADFDLVQGDVGDDQLFGDEGDDILRGGLGNDVLDGGVGFDRLSYFTGASAAVTVDLRIQGVAQDTGGGGIDTLISIENSGGTPFADVLIGDNNANWLLGQGGADTLSGNGGNDTLYTLDSDGGSFDGGDGLDVISFTLDTGNVTVDLGIQGAAQDTTQGLVTLNGVEGAEGSEFDDTIQGSSGNNVLSGRAGADVINGLGGDDFIQGDIPVRLLGEVPTDFNDPSYNHGNDTLSGGDGHDAIFGNRGDDVLDGGSGDDGIEGGDGSDLIVGGGGDDWLDGGPGEDTIDGGDGDDSFLQLTEANVNHLAGGAGVDRLDCSSLDSGVVVQLSGYATTDEGAPLALFSGIENVTGSRFNDALIGDSADNLLAGGHGADWIVGAGGDDRFMQRADGLDHLFGGTPGADAGFDTIDYTFAQIAVVVQLSGYATILGDTSAMALFAGIEGAIGSSFDDALIGTAADNRIEGGEGSDWLVGAAGDDWFVQGTQAGVDRLFGDAGTDTIDYGAAGAGVTVQLNGWATLSGGVTLATFTGIENAVGSNFADAIIGSGLDNRITGGTGADWLVGAAGDDTFVQTIDTTAIDRIFGGTPGADAGTADTIDYSGASSGVVVQLSGYATTNGGGNITLATFAGIENAIGSNSADALIGNAGANALTGGGGADWLVGGAGNDTFVYRTTSDGAGDSIRDFAQGADKIDFSAIDANPGTGGDDAFAFATTRHAGVLGEAVVTNSGGFSLVSLHLDADNTADMTIQVVHEAGLVMNANDFVL